MWEVSIKRKELDEILKCIKRVLAKHAEGSNSISYSGFLYYSDIISPYTVEDRGKIVIDEGVLVKSFFPFKREEDEEPLDFKLFALDVVSVINETKGIKTITMRSTKDELEVYLNDKRFVLARKVEDEYDKSCLMKDYYDAYDKYYDLSRLFKDIIKYDHILTESELEELKMRKVDIKTPVGIVRLGRQHFPFLSVVYANKPLPIKVKLWLYHYGDAQVDPLAIWLDVDYGLFKSIHFYEAVVF